MLLDLMMPRLNGWQVIERLHQEPALLKDSKVVLVSTDWRLDSRGQALSSEIVVARLRKPVDVEELLTLARALAGKVNSSPRGGGNPRDTTYLDRWQFRLHRGQQASDYTVVNRLGPLWSAWAPIPGTRQANEDKE